MNFVRRDRRVPAGRPPTGGIPRHVGAPAWL